MIPILDFIAYYYHHRIKFQINILVWRKALLLLYQEVFGLFIQFLACDNCKMNFFCFFYSEKTTPNVLLSSYSLWDKDETEDLLSPWWWRFSMKNLCPSPKYILLRSIICSILTPVGTGLYFKRCQCQAGLEEWSIKRNSKTCVSHLCDIHFGLLFLQDRLQHIDPLSMCCS